jgi:hypothetical protein
MMYKSIGDGPPELDIAFIHLEMNEEPRPTRPFNVIWGRIEDPISGRQWVTVIDATGTILAFAKMNRRNEAGVQFLLDLVEAKY